MIFHLRYKEFLMFLIYLKNYQRIGTKLLVQNANYFRDGRVVVESVGVGRFKVNEVEQIDGYDSATFVAIIDQPPKKSELSRLGDLLNQVCSFFNNDFLMLQSKVSVESEVALCMSWYKS